ncbi:MAG: hypothetical protein WCF94_00035 [bacterium]
MSGQVRPSSATVWCIKGQPCRVYARHNKAEYIIKKDDCAWGRENDCEYFTDDGCAFFNKELKKRAVPDDGVVFLDNKTVEERK